MFPTSPPSQASATSFYALLASFSSLSRKHKLFLILISLFLLYIVFYFGVIANAHARALKGRVLYGASSQRQSHFIHGSDTAENAASGSSRHAISMQKTESGMLMDSNAILNSNTGTKAQKTLVVFTCSAQPISQINTDFFLDFGVFASEHVDFLIVCSERYPLNVPKHLGKNVKIVFTEGAQHKSDFDSWRDALKRAALDDYADYTSPQGKSENNASGRRLWSTIKRGSAKRAKHDHRKNYSAAQILDRLRKKYKHFVLLNSALRGPFLQTFAKRDLWPFYLTQYISPTTKLVGLIGNYDSGSSDDSDSSSSQQNASYDTYHVQALVLAFDLKFLILTWDKVFDNSHDTISRDGDRNRRKEILATQLVLGAGYKSHVISWVMHDMDPFGDIKNTMDHSKNPGDCKISGYNSFLPNCYFGNHPNLFEFMFMTTNHPDWLNPATMRKILSQHTRFHYYSYFQCNSPDYSTYGASCKTRGPWLYRDEHFQCANLIPSAFDSKHVNQYLTAVRARTVLDIGGGLGHHCFELLKKDVKECTVLEPAPLYGCLRDKVEFIRGDVLDTNFDLDAQFDAAMLINTVKHMHLSSGNFQNIVKFLRKNVRSTLILSPIDEDFISALHQKMTFKVQKHVDENVAVIHLK